MSIVRNEPMRSPPDCRPGRAPGDTVEHAHRSAPDHDVKDRRTAVTDQLPDIASEHLLRELAPQVLGVVIRRFRDFAAAEDAVQEA